MPPIAEIIFEIDAYLTRLRQARELLSGGRKEPSPNKAHRRKEKILARQTSPVIPNRSRSEKGKPPSPHRVTHLKKTRAQVDGSSPLPIPAPLDFSHAEQQPIASVEPTREPSVVVTRFPAKRGLNSIRSERHRPAKPAAATKPYAIKPAIALAGPIHTKVVVVSAEQARQQREQASPPAVQRPRIPSSGLSGRRAFEALFKNEPEPSKTSGQ